MTQPVWLIEEVVLGIHTLQLEEHGGKVGIRDRNMLLSALSRPKNSYNYGDSDIMSLAVDYIYGIIKNHPFIDGNKRTAYVVMATFLHLNGFMIEASEEDKYLQVIALAEDKITIKEFKNWLAKASKRMS